MAVIVLGLMASAPAFAEELKPEEARRFIAGKLFAFNCFEGTRGARSHLRGRFGRRLGPVRRQRSRSQRPASGRHAASQAGGGLRFHAGPAVPTLLKSAEDRSGELPAIRFPGFGFAYASSIAIPAGRSRDRRVRAPPKCAPCRQRNPIDDDDFWCEVTAPASQAWRGPFLHRFTPKRKRAAGRPPVRSSIARFGSTTRLSPPNGGILFVRCRPKSLPPSLATRSASFSRHQLRRNSPGRILTWRVAAR